MATATKSISINAAFLREIKEDHLELGQTLRESKRVLELSVIPSLPAKQMVDLLSELRDRFAMHFTLEEAFGYFEDAIDVAPHLGQRSEALRREHEPLFLEVCALVDEAEQLLYHEAGHHSRRRIGANFRLFFEHFQDHESREKELILQALDEDIGVGD
jgi:hypothetical protein